jgi:hypothetical protein
MSGEKPFRPREYVCPICGERTTFGTHFCQGGKGPKARPRLAEPIKRTAIALVGLVLIEATLWDLIGLYSLYVLAAAPLAALAALAIRRSPLGRARREYRELCRLAGGDREAAERLVSLEKLRKPGVSRAEAVRAALDSYERDLR